MQIILHGIWEFVSAFFFGYGVFVFVEDVAQGIKNRRKIKRRSKEVEDFYKRNS